MDRNEIILISVIIFLFVVILVGLFLLRKTRRESEMQRREVFLLKKKRRESEMQHSRKINKILGSLDNGELKKVAEAIADTINLTTQSFEEAGDYIFHPNGAVFKNREQKVKGFLKIKLPMSWQELNLRNTRHVKWVPDAEYNEMYSNVE